MRLELLAAELAPVFADVPADMDNFDFAISSGPAAATVDRCRQPRRHGARPSHLPLPQGHAASAASCSPKSTDMKPVADQVTRYVAERIVERQRMMEGGVEPVLPPALPRAGAGSRAAAAAAAAQVVGRFPVRPCPDRWPARWSGWLCRPCCSGTARRDRRSASDSLPAGRMPHQSSTVSSSAGGIAGPVRPRRVSRMRQSPCLAVDVDQVVLRRRCLGRPAPGRRRRRRRPGLCACVPPIKYSVGRCEWPCRTSSAPWRRTDFLEAADAEQALVLRNRAAHRRMVDHDRRGTARACRFRRACCASRSRLALAKEAVGHERSGRARRRDADQRDVAAHAQIGEGVAVDRPVVAVAGHPRRPDRQTLSKAPGT